MVKFSKTATLKSKCRKVKIDSILQRYHAINNSTAMRKKAGLRSRARPFGKTPIANYAAAAPLTTSMISLVIAA